MRDLVILGGSGIGMIAASVAEALGTYRVIGFLNDIFSSGTMIGKYKNFPVLGPTEKYHDYIKNGCSLFIGYVGMKKEEDVFKKISSINIPDDQWASLIDPTAIIPSGYCKIGKGCLFAPLSQLSPDTTISDNCILLPNSFVGHDSFLDRFAHVATNAVVGANVHVGKAVHVGSNSTIREKVTIGDFSLIGAGAVVLKDVSPSSIVVGNPAKLLSTSVEIDPRRY